MSKTKKISKGKRLSAVTLSAFLAGTTVSPAYFKAFAAEASQDYSTVGGVADKLLQKHLDDALRNSNLTADQVVNNRYDNFIKVTAATKICESRRSKTCSIMACSVMSKDIRMVKTLPPL